MIYTHQIRVRYGELDPQGVVFNANYLAYCDDAFDRWLHSTILKSLEELGLDVMLKKVVLEWDAPARLGDELTIEVQVLRWGDTSFDVQFQASKVFRAVITYVCVRHLTTSPMRFPDELRGQL
jgi:acyl-CoA thioester hydrolase